MLIYFRDNLHGFKVKTRWCFFSRLFALFCDNWIVWFFIFFKTYLTHLYLFVFRPLFISEIVNWAILRFWKFPFFLMTACMVVNKFEPLCVIHLYVYRSNRHLFVSCNLICWIFQRSKIIKRHKSIFFNFYFFFFPRHRSFYQREFV